MVALALEPVLAALPTLAAGDLPVWRPYFEYLGVYHPAVSHFPIALLTVAGLFEAWSIVRRQKQPSQSTLACLYIGTLAAVAATVLGWADADRTGDKGDTLDLHKWLGIAVAILAVVTLVLSILVRRAKASRKVVWTYRGGVLASAALVGFVGSLGGKLVHGNNYYEEALAELREQIGEGTELAADAAEDGVDAAKEVAKGTADAVKTLPSALAQPLVAVVAGPAGGAPPAPGADGVPSTQPVDGPDAGPTTEPTTAPTNPASPAEAPAALAVAQVAASPGQFGGGRIDYARDIQPIFLAECSKCHSESKKIKGEYRMDTPQQLFTAGETGEVPIVPGKSGDSYLVKLIEGKGEFEDLIMPPKGKPLTPQQIELIRRWIDEGAKTDAH